MIHIKIITPKGLFLENDVDSVNVKTVEGYRTILSNHIPLVAMLDICKCSMHVQGVRHTYAIAGGILQMHQNEMRILSDAVEAKADIDIDRSLKAKERAEQRIQKQAEDIDMQRAEVALAKAINRIKTYEEH